MLDKPSREEDEYFAREDVEKKRKLAYQQAQVMAEQQKEALRTLHYMKCPKCGFDLHAVLYKGLTIDKCFHCGGTWLDAGELEALAGRESHVLKQIVSLFKRG